MSLKKANLEDVFIELTENDGEKQPSEGRAQTAKAGESEGMSKDVYKRQQLLFAKQEFIKTLVGDAL